MELCSSGSWLQSWGIWPEEMKIVSVFSQLVTADRGAAGYKIGPPVDIKGQMFTAVYRGSS